MVVVVAETDENDAETTRSADEVRGLQERFVRAWLQAVRARDASVPVAGFSQEVVTLLPVASGADALGSRPGSSFIARQSVEPGSVG